MSNQVTSLRMSDTTFLDRIKKFKRIAKHEKINDRLLKLLKNRVEIMKILNRNSEKLAALFEAKP